MRRTINRWAIAALFIFAGANHFLSPRPYLELMPPYLPWHQALVYFSGAAEVALGAVVLVPALQRPAGWGLIALLVAVFPANLHAALHGFRAVPGWILWVRLPLQLVLVAWVYWSCAAVKAQAQPPRAGE